MRRAVFALVAAIHLAGAEAHANPDVWVETSYLFRVDGGTLTGVRLTWRHDAFYSDRAIRSFDADRDGTFSEQEAAKFRDRALSSLAAEAYHLHAEVDGQSARLTVLEASPSIADGRLVLALEALLTPPVAYRSETLALSLHDPSRFYDFAFADGDFLRVSGELAPGCTFRIGPGRMARADHPRVVRLTCGSAS